MCESSVSAVPAEVVDAFTSAAITALQELTQIEAHPEPNLQTTEVTPGQVVSAAIRLLREVPGTMILVLSAEVAAQLAARYLPASTLVTEELIDDVAGEFANVIAGQAKTILKGTSYHFMLSTPMVVRAPSLAQASRVADVRFVVALASELGQVLLLVALPPCPNS